jgi:lipid-A-disaccharide synthase-like uncharacterized protein
MARSTMSWDAWLILGFAAQIMFYMRFIVQWIESEKKGASVIPTSFWYFSFFGGLLLFFYAIHRKDPVFIMGQGAGLFIYARNIMFIWRKNNVLEKE